MPDGEEPVAEPTLESLNADPIGSGGAAERPDLLELAQSGRVGAKSVSAEDDYLAVPELLQRAESGYEAVRPVSRVPGLFPLSTDLTNEYLKQDDRRLPAQEEYLWMSWFGAHMAALFLQLQVAGVGEDVAAGVDVAAKDAFGSDELGQRTLDLLSSSPSAQTLKSYAGRLSQFAEFCHDSENISPLEATTATVVRYVAWIGERGHIAAKSLQPYLSAINTFFELHNLVPIAKDSLHLTSARRGLMLRQRRLDAAPLRVPLPADVAYRFVTKAELIVSAPYPEYHLDFRALLASVVHFMFFARGLTGVSCRVRDVHVDTYNITLQVYHEKGRASRRGPDDLRVLLLPVSEHPRVAEAIWQRDYIERHLSGFGLLRNPNKGVWEPTQKLVHLGLEIDTSGSPTLRAPAEKLASIARAAKRLIQRAKRDRRWLPARELAALAGKCQFLYLAIALARFYLRELHDVLKTRDSWSGRVKLSRQLERDLQWWVGVPTQHNGRPINRPVETGYLHVDSSSYGWGAVLNEHHEARGFWYDDDRNAHITLKELKAVRLAIESFLPMLQNRHIRLHEDNQAVVGVLTNITSRSPRLMAELRKTWYFMDTHGITLSVRYIRSAANIWADRLSREVDCDDWQFNPRRFASLTAKWGACTIDRFATSENALLPRYNARWRDPRCEAVDALRLSDAAWRCERNWCNPPWNLIGDLVSKLESSGAPAIVIVPYWPDKAWYHLLSEMCSDMRSWKPRHDLFIPGRTGGRLPVGAPRWPVVAFNIPARDPRPWPAAPGIF
eukprot:jgi/Tetstr1/437602/TSEL_026269.t1